MQVRLNDREMEALQGLPWFARCLYVFGIRPYMDYRTGTVGIVRGVSWQSIAEALYVEPHQGETDSGTPDKSRVRRAAARLEKAGLIVLRSIDKRLVFQCLLADTDQSAQNKPDTNPTQTRHSKAGTANANSGAGFAGEPDTNPTQTRHSKPGTPPVSGIREEGNEEHSLRSCSSAAPPSDAAENAPVVIRLPTLQGEHAVTDADLAEYASLFPALDVLQELRSMRAWLLANPSNRKTARGIKRFIANWLTRSQDRATPARSNHREVSQPVDNSAIARVRRANGIPHPGRIIEGEFRRA